MRRIGIMLLTMNMSILLTCKGEILDNEPWAALECKCKCIITQKPVHSAWVSGLGIRE